MFVNLSDNLKVMRYLPSQYIGPGQIDQLASNSSFKIPYLLKYTNIWYIFTIAPRGAYSKDGSRPGETHHQGHLTLMGTHIGAETSGAGGHHFAPMALRFLPGRAPSLLQVGGGLKLRYAIYTYVKNGSSWPELEAGTHREA